MGKCPKCLDLIWEEEEVKPTRTLCFVYCCDIRDLYAPGRGWHISGRSGMSVGGEWYIDLHQWGGGNIYPGGGRFVLTWLMAAGWGGGGKKKV